MLETIVISQEHCLLLGNLLAVGSPFNRICPKSETKIQHYKVLVFFLYLIIGFSPSVFILYISFPLRKSEVFIALISLPTKRSLFLLSLQFSMHKSQFLSVSSSWAMPELGLAWPEFSNIKHSLYGYKPVLLNTGLSTCPPSFTAHTINQGSTYLKELSPPLTFKVRAHSVSLLLWRKAHQKCQRSRAGESSCWPSFFHSAG